MQMTILTNSPFGHQEKEQFFISISSVTIWRTENESLHWSNQEHGDLTRGSKHKDSISSPERTVPPVFHTSSYSL